MRVMLKIILALRWPRLEALDIMCIVRAHLVLAAVAAMAIQVGALIAILVADVPEQVFATSAFRLSALASIMAVMLVVKRMARQAYCVGIGRNDVVFTDRPMPRVSVSLTCPQRPLVILHTKLVGLALNACDR
jgi:hypothetical protein